MKWAEPQPNVLHEETERMAAKTELGTIIRIKTRIKITSDKA